jgi:hypothetical protein
MILIPHSRANPIATTNPFHHQNQLKKFIANFKHHKPVNKQNTFKHINEQQTLDFWHLQNS